MRNVKETEHTYKTNKTTHYTKLVFEKLVTVGLRCDMRQRWPHAKQYSLEITTLHYKVRVELDESVVV